MGFWGHWGPQSVPMYGGWYARNCISRGALSIFTNCPVVKPAE
ncbi:MAG: alpha-L-fucosidase [Treponema sp.]|nr:alpha-L-fucosidase [Treponema sp.]